MIKLKAANVKAGVLNHVTLIPNPTASDQIEWQVGRSEGQDLHLPYPEVSRNHAKIQWKRSGYYFIDLGSTQGSWLNGEKLEPREEYPLQTGDEVRLAEIDSTILYFDELLPLSKAVPVDQGIPVSPDLAYWTQKDLLVECYRIDIETPDAKTFWFRGAESEVNFDYYWPGQFATLEIEIDGKTVRHPYSVSSAPIHEYSLTITVKRVPGGSVSNWLHDRFAVGDTLKLVGGPSGIFSCISGLCVPELPPKLLFITAGSGITPIMSMLRWLYITPSFTDIVMLHCDPTPESIIFYDELRAVIAKMPNLRLQFTITRPGETRAWSGLTGRISKEMLSLVAPDLTDRTAFVCGPNKFMHHTKMLLEALQFPMERFYAESFGGRPPSSSPPTPTSAAPEPSIETAATTAVTNNAQPTTAPSQPQTSSAADANTVTVEFLDSNQTVQASPESTLLEIADQAGINLDWGCGIGGCGRCKVAIVRGTVQYRQDPNALKEDEKAANITLACVAQPIGTVAIRA